MRMKLIERSEASALLDGNYNHPEQSEIGFEKECADVVAKITVALSEVGSVAVDEASKEVDFNFSKYDAATRSIFVVCSQPRVFSE